MTYLKLAGSWHTRFLECCTAHTKKSFRINDLVSTLSPFGTLGTLNSNFILYYCFLFFKNKNNNIQVSVPTVPNSSILGHFWRKFVNEINGLQRLAHSKPIAVVKPLILKAFYFHAAVQRRCHNPANWHTSDIMSNKNCSKFHNAK